MSEILTHPRFAVSADAEIWKALGWSVCTDMDGAAYVSGSTSTYGADYNALLATAVADGKTGTDALAWVATEHNRRSEARTAATALARQAEAIQSLANALRTEKDASVLQKIMHNLTEPTQWAIRKQLAGTGLLPG